MLDPALPRYAMCVEFEFAGRAPTASAARLVPAPVSHGDWCKWSDVERHLRAVEAAHLDKLLRVRADAHGDGQMHALADVNAGLVDDMIQPRLRAVEAAHQQELEHAILRLAACDVAALSNTRDTYANAECGRENPAWSPAYASVRAAVLREMEYRETLEARADAAEARRPALDAAPPASGRQMNVRKPANI